ncbi:MAG: sulfate reduction electron transfer complex DsrMKJOP subunit DsrJ [Planctomycetota bacterium]
MSDKPAIVVGLVIFLGLVTFPFWYARATGPTAAPVVEMPKNAAQCVEDKAYMTAHHMELLNEWRDAVVRDGRNEYVSRAFGTHFDMSLTKTCLGCHEDRQTSCDRCHTYADVHPGCWDCHVAPKGN